MSETKSQERKNKFADIRTAIRHFILTFSKKGAANLPNSLEKTGSEPAFEVTEKEQRLALAAFHLQKCKIVDEDKLTDSGIFRALQPMTSKRARSHWFEYNPPPSACVAQPEHEGKKYKSSSDTWTRLESALEEIKRRHGNASSVPYRERVKRIPDDLW